MKIAVPTRNNNVDDHFGHCEFYIIYSVDENKKIASKEIIASPQGCGCKSNIAGILQQMEVSIMLAGNIGEGALYMLDSFGIKVVRGCRGNTDHVVKEYLAGNLKDTGIICDQHQHGHQCEN